jgi:hypothetical protein
MRYRFGALMVASCLATGLLSVTPALVQTASATTVVSLTKDVTVSSPPSGSFAGATSGDGWDISFYRDRVFNVFHHGQQFLIDCHLQSDGSHCDTVEGISPWPKTVSSPDPVSEFTSPAHASGWMDTNSGRFYGWASRIADGTGGVVCVDLTTPENNPFCGFTALTDAGANTETDTTVFGGRATVGTEMYAYDVSIGKVLCLSTATFAACAGQPYDLPIGGISPMQGGWTDNSTVAAGGKVFVHVDDENATGGVFTCFDPQTKATCAGSWPQLVSDAYPGAVSEVGAAFPYLSTTGTVLGACLPYDGVDPCWDLTGAPITTPAAMISALGNTDMWNDGAVLGTRVFVPTGEADGVNIGVADAVFCYDFATGASCPNFPIETGNTTYLYTVTPDPIRTGCMWINADGSGNGGTQIRTFDGFDGSAGCADRVHVASSVVIPDSSCNALGWSNVQVLDPDPSAYTTASLSLTDAQGVPVPNGTGLTADGTGTFDLSGLTIPDSVLFTATFNDPTFSQTGVIFRFTWSSTSSDTCNANATRVPDAPTINSVTPNSSDGGLTVAFVAPVDPGTSPITAYLYSTDGGVTWRNRGDAGTSTSPLEITQSSADGTSLTDGTAYTVLIRAVNDVGTGLASNALAGTAVVPELLSAPTTAALVAGSPTAVNPVYLAGFTTPITVDATTTNGTLSVVGNAGLTEFPCTTCSGATISFHGAQAAVNVALATMTATAAIAGAGTATVAITRDGDSSPSQTAVIDLSASLSRLATPTTPTGSATSASIIDVSFAPVTSATSYTVRVYRADGSTPVGAAHTNFATGSGIGGLSAGTNYKFTVTAIGDNSVHSDSLASAQGSTTTLAAPVPPTFCGTPRPSQWLPSGTGSVFAVGADRRIRTVPSFSSVGAALKRPIIGAVATASGKGSWSLTSDGGIFTAGDSPFEGSLAQHTLKAPVASVVGTPCVRGYDILATDGGVFSFGDAHFYGSMGATKLNQPMAGMALTCSGHGYYTVAGDGGVFTFGTARFHGSMARLHLVSPIFDIIPNCGDTGYWMVARDGGVFTVGAVGYYGSMGGKKLTAPITGLLPTPTGHGYWLTAANGTTYPFGDAVS